MNVAKARPRNWAVHRLIIPIALIMAAVGGLLLGVTFYSAQSMNGDALRRQQELIDNSFTSRMARGLGEIRSVAWWDDTVTYTAPDTFDKEWLDQEIGSYMVESYVHDRIMVLDEQDRPIYAFGEGTGLGTRQLGVDLKAAAPIIRQIRGGPDVSPRVQTTAPPGGLYEIGEYGNRKFSRGFGAIMKVDGRPAFALASLITPSYDTSAVSPLRRIVLTIVEIDDEVLKEIGRDTLMPDLSFAKPQDERKGAFELRTDDGQYLATLRWDPARPGTVMLKRVLPWIGAALLTSIILLALLMTRLTQSGMRLSQREQEAQYLANHDALTGLPNRRMLQAELERFAAEAERDGGTVAVACVDVDRFKDINDTLGHHAGDQLIRKVAARLRQSMLGSDIVARLGGDEFAVMRSCASSCDADLFLAAIRSCFQEPFEIENAVIEANASVGLALSGPDRPVEDLMREADIALYEAKARGRACDVCFEPAMAREIEKRRMLEVDLRKDIARRNIAVVYQPIVDAATGQIASVEALARWTSARHGEVPPSVFIPLAEETGLMADLGRLIMEKAVADSRKWPQFKTSINVSAAQLRSASFLRDLMQIIESHEVSPEKLTLEITESLLMSNDRAASRMMSSIKEQGFALAVDDFGTGYSSLAYIRDFAFDSLKIDRSFVQGLGESENARAIVEAIANVGRILGKQVVAEGVETEQEMQAMQLAGCTHLQGFLFSKPVPAARIEAVAALGRLSAIREPEVRAAEERVAQRRITKRT